MPTEFNPNDVGLRNGRFIGLPFIETEAKIVLLSVPWDLTASYGKGTATGPQNILETSPQLDLYDPDIPEAWKMGIYLRHPDLTWLDRNDRLQDQAMLYVEHLEAGEPVNAEMQAILEEVNQACVSLNQWVKAETAQLLKKGKLVGVVGGEHSVPLGFLQTLAEQHEEFGVLQIDAHMDLRKAYEGFTYSHASIFYNALQLPQLSKLVQVGIRDYCEEEIEVAEKEGERVQVFTDQDIRESIFQGKPFSFLCQQMIAFLPEKVYVSFDIDGLDPGLCPNTGTPVPGGFSFNEAMYLLKTLARSGRTIIGFDLCEVGGLETEWDGNVGARVLYKLSNWMGVTNGIG